MTQINPYELLAHPFWDVLDDFIDQSHDEYWLKGGRGSTKSSFVSVAIVLGLMLDNNANALVYRRIGNTLRDSVYAQFAWAIDELRLTPWFQFRLSPMEITYKPTGQRILFRGADDPMKSKSIKLTRGYFKYLWFEELSEFRGMEDIRTIKQSAFRGVSHACTLYSYNPPKSAQNWVNAEAIKPTARRLVHSSTYLDVPPEWLGEKFIADAEALRDSNERAYANEYLGEVTGTGGQVFDNIELRAILDDEINIIDRFYNGLDFGFAVDPDAFTRWGYDRRKRTLWAIDEFYGAHNSVDRLASEATSRAHDLPVRCDSADPRMINELTRRGVNATGVKKGPGSVEHGMRWLQDLGHIIIDPARTPNIAREFAAYEYTRDRNGNFLSDYPDRDNHTIDSARYALEPEIGMRRLGTMDARKLGL